MTTRLTLVETLFSFLQTFALLNLFIFAFIVGTRGSEANLIGASVLFSFDTFVCIAAFGGMASPVGAIEIGSTAIGNRLVRALPLGAAILRAHIPVVAVLAALAILAAADRGVDASAEAACRRTRVGGADVVVVALARGRAGPAAEERDVETRALRARIRSAHILVVALLVVFAFLAYLIWNVGALIVLAVVVCARVLIVAMVIKSTTPLDSNITAYASGRTHPLSIAHVFCALILVVAIFVITATHNSAR